MRCLLTILLGGVLLCGGLSAQQEDFRREGKPEQRALKDPLEGKAPPALQVESWLNTEKPIDLADLRGKVVVLDFWGVW